MGEPKTDGPDAETGVAAAPNTQPGQENLVLPLEGNAPTEPYSIFSRTEKWFIVAMVAVAGFYR